MGWAKKEGGLHTEAAFSQILRPRRRSLEPPLPYDEASDRLTREPRLILESGLTQQDFWSGVGRIEPSLAGTIFEANTGTEVVFLEAEERMGIEVFPALDTRAVDEVQEARLASGRELWCTAGRDVKLIGTQRTPRLDWDLLKEHADGHALESCRRHLSALPDKIPWCRRSAETRALGREEIRGRAAKGEKREQFRLGSRRLRVTL